MGGKATKPGQLINRGKNVWLVRVYVGRDENKKRRYVNRTVHGTKKQAQAVLTALLRDRDTGTQIEPSREPLNTYLDRWLEVAARPRLREKTHRDYANLLQRHIRSTLGMRPLSRVTPLDIQAVYGRMEEQSLSARTIRYTHAVLRSAMAQAVKWRLLGLNPADAVELPRQRKEEMGVLSAEKARSFLAAVKEDRYGTLFLLALTTGLRASEYLALKWEDIDLTKGSLAVRRTLARHKGGGWSFEEVKRTRSRRTVKLPADVTQALHGHRKRQLEERLQAGESWRDNGLVFTTSNGEPVHERGLIKYHFKKALSEAGLPDIRLYDLRHSAATLALQAGVAPKVVSEMLGHSSVAFTLDTYAHVLPNMQDDAAASMQALLFGTLGTEK